MFLLIFDRTANLRMVEDKFGKGSDEHCQSLQELSDACLSAGKPGLAAPMLINLSRQEGNSFRCVLLWAMGLLLKGSILRSPLSLSLSDAEVFDRRTLKRHPFFGASPFGSIRQVSPAFNMNQHPLQIV